MEYRECPQQLIRGLFGMRLFQPTAEPREVTMVERDIKADVETYGPYPMG